MRKRTASCPLRHGRGFVLADRLGSPGLQSPRDPLSYRRRLKTYEYSTSVYVSLRGEFSLKNSFTPCFRCEKWFTLILPLETK